MGCQYYKEHLDAFPQAVEPSFMVAVSILYRPLMARVNSVF